MFYYIFEKSMLSTTFFWKSYMDLIQMLHQPKITFEANICYSISKQNHSEKNKNNICVSKETKPYRVKIFTRRKSKRILLQLRLSKKFEFSYHCICCYRYKTLNLLILIFGYENMKQLVTCVLQMYKQHNCLFYICNQLYIKVSVTHAGKH